MITECLPRVQSYVGVEPREDATHVFRRKFETATRGQSNIQVRLPYR